MTIWIMFVISMIIMNTLKILNLLISAYDDEEYDYSEYDY